MTKIYKTRIVFLLVITLLTSLVPAYAIGTSTEKNDTNYNMKLDEIAKVVVSNFDQYQANVSPNYAKKEFRGKVTYEVSYFIYGQFHSTTEIAKTKTTELQQHYKEYFSKEGVLDSRTINGYEILTVITPDAEFGSNYYIWCHNNVVLSVGVGVKNELDESSLRQYMDLIHPLIDQEVDKNPLIEIEKVINYYYEKNSINYVVNKNQVTGDIYIGDKAVGVMNVLIETKGSEQMATNFVQKIYKSTYPSEGYELSTKTIEGITVYIATDDKPSHWDTVMASYKQYFIKCSFPSSTIDMGEVKDLIEKIKPILDGEEAPETDSAVLDEHREPADEQNSSEEVKQISDIFITLEKDYKGVIADGTNRLEISIKAPKGSDGILNISQPSIGEIVNTNGKAVDSININGKDITLYYQPPKYIEDKYLTEKLEAPSHIGSSSPTNIWVAPAKLIFIYEPKERVMNKGLKTYQFPLKVCRPTVILLHGFTGDKTTWEELDGVLRTKKYDTVREEYYVNNESGQSIPAQANALHIHVTGAQKSYEKLGIKAGKVDLVGHSMGGLISRQYISQTPEQYNGGVKKLIMVGTPNHGCSYFNSWVGWLQSTLFSAHKEAGEQLYGKNPLILALNKGEELGEHLDKNVQYGILYGKGLGAFSDGDIVVPELSAKLQGVKAIGYEGRAHSSAFGPSITNDDEILEQITRWLQEDIPKGDYSHVEIKVYDWEGESIYLSDPDGEGLIGIEEDEASEIYCFQEIETLDHSRIGLKLTSKGSTFGYVDISPNTKLNFTYVSPDRVEVFMEHGSARFTTKAGKEHHFTVYQESNGEIKVIKGLDTDFVATSFKQGLNVEVLEGEVELINSIGVNNQNIVIASADDVMFVGEGSSIENSKPIEAWWENDFYKNKPKELDLHMKYIILIALIAIVVLFFIFKIKKKK